MATRKILLASAVNPDSPPRPGLYRLPIELLNPVAIKDRRRTSAPWDRQQSLKEGTHWVVAPFGVMLMESELNDEGPKVSSQTEILNARAALAIAPLGNLLKMRRLDGEAAKVMWPFLKLIEEKPLLDPKEWSYSGLVWDILDMTNNSSATNVISRLVQSGILEPEDVIRERLDFWKLCFPNSKIEGA